MCKPMPFKNFNWSNDLTLDKLQTRIYEVDIEISKNLHNKFKDYPLCPQINQYQKIIYQNIKNI